MSSTASCTRSAGTAGALILLVTLAVLRGDTAASPVMASAAPPGVATSTTPPPAALVTAGEFVLPPARPYAPNSRDLGAGFSERNPKETRERQSFQTTVVRSSKPDGAVADVFQIEVYVDIAAPGGDDEVNSYFAKRLSSLRTKPGTGPHLELGWAADEVRTSDWSERGAVVCGIALRHRNAVAMVTAHGYERLPTCNTAARLMRTVEARVLAAIQEAAWTEGAPRVAP